MVQTAKKSTEIIPARGLPETPGGKSPGAVCAETLGSLPAALGLESNAAATPDGSCTLAPRSSDHRGPPGPTITGHLLSLFLALPSGVRLHAHRYRHTYNSGTGGPKNWGCLQQMGCLLEGVGPDPTLPVSLGPCLSFSGFAINWLDVSTSLLAGVLRAHRNGRDAMRDRPIRSVEKSDAQQPAHAGSSP